MRLLGPSMALACGLADGGSEIVPAISVASHGDARMVLKGWDRWRPKIEKCAESAVRAEYLATRSMVRRRSFALSASEIVTICRLNRWMRPRSSAGEPAEWAARDRQGGPACRRSAECRRIGSGSFWKAPCRITVPVFQRSCACSGRERRSLSTDGSRGRRRLRRWADQASRRGQTRVWRTRRVCGSLCEEGDPAWIRRGNSQVPRPWTMAGVRLVCGATEAPLVGLAGWGRRSRVRMDATGGRSRDR